MIEQHPWVRPQPDGAPRQLARRVRAAEPLAVADPRDVQRIDRELAARRARYMKELRPPIIALEKRISDIVHERHASWQRLEAAFNERMLARHDAEAAGRP
jgi:hypothetical protein